MRIILIQSRYQNIFNRIYLGVHTYLWVILPMLVLPVIWEREINWDSIQLTLLFGFIIISSISIWLFVFNRGDGAVIEYGLEMTDEGISYIRYGSKTQIKWCDFNGFQIINKWPRMILLKGKGGKMIEFSYYTFSGEQRLKLFQTLASM
ncbi:hypothetical protein ABMY35_13600 [Pseudoalteromonas sp. BZB3]|uniref:hypothetical protein n=1 Tax=Pseudoalteromonas sp. BZB3 TaxID=3136670 RepID=UPI0032C3FC5F